jgi:hypothetical protein
LLRSQDGGPQTLRSPRTYNYDADSKQREIPHKCHGMTENPQRNARADVVTTRDWKNQLGESNGRSNQPRQIPNARPRTELILILILICHVISACQNHQQEREFLRNPRNQVERLRSYSLPEQYKIFRYGNDFVEPPILKLADPIAERGEAAVPFLKDQLNSSEDGIELRDILWVFERMKAMGSYDVSSNPDLIRLLTTKVHGMKDTFWQKTCLESLQIINASK